MNQLTPTASFSSSRFLIPLLMTCLALVGCNFSPDSLLPIGPAKLTVTSQSNPGAVLKGNFKTAVYSSTDKNEATLVLLDGTEDNPRQAAVIQMFWRPRASRTPIDVTATNATIHYYIFPGTDREIAGIYSGAGFVFPEKKPGESRLKAHLWDATLRLTDSSPRFEDPLGLAIAHGSVEVRRDPETTQRLLQRLQSLRYQRLVSNH